MRRMANACGLGRFPQDEETKRNRASSGARARVGEPSATARRVRGTRRQTRLIAKWAR